MKKSLVYSLAGLAVVVAAVYGWRTLHGQPEARARSVPVTPAVPVTIGKSVLRTVPIELSVIGRAEAKASVTVKSRVDGQVVSVAFQEGQPVKKGQMLVRLDPASYAAQLRQIEATSAKGQAQLQKLRVDVARYRDLSQKGFISDVQLSQTQTDFTASEASARADTAAGDNAKLLLSYTSIRAPMDGVAGAAQVHPGANVKANDTALLVINQVQPIYASFSVPEARLAQLKVALARHPVDVTATIPDTDVAMKGQIAFIDNAVDVATGTILVKALFRNENNVLTPGQFVNILLAIDRLDNVLVVPTPAVQTGPQGNFVFVVKQDHSVELRPVEVRVAVGSETVLTSGLAAGETVVTDGQSRLKAGFKVEVVSGAGGTPSAEIPQRAPKAEAAAAASDSVEPRADGEATSSRSP